MSAADEYAISVAKTDYREAYNTGDVDRLLSVFADSFTNMSEGEPGFYGSEGKQALRLQTSKLFQRYHAKMEVIIIVIAVLSETAYDYGWHKLTLTPKSGGAPEVRSYRYCEIWKREPDSKWKIGFFMTSKDHEPRMLEEMAVSA